MAEKQDALVEQTSTQRSTQTRTASYLSLLSKRLVDARLQRVVVLILAEQIAQKPRSRARHSPVSRANAIVNAKTRDFQTGRGN